MGGHAATADVGGKVAVSPRLRRRAAVPDAGSPQGMPLRRRWGRFAIGAFLALLGGWVSASLYISAGDRVEVVVMADDVNAYEQIQRDDLRVVRVAADPGVETVDGDDIDQVVDRYAATDLVEGSVLAPNHLFREDARRIEDGEVLVGAEPETTDAPEELCTGRDVQLVIAAGGGEDGQTAPIPGWLYEVGSRDDDTGQRSVTIAVDAEQAPEVSAAAQEGRLSINLEEPC